jgi:hypothetical protein
MRGKKEGEASFAEEERRHAAALQTVRASQLRSPPLNLLNSAFDFTFEPFVDRSPLLSLLAFAIATALLVLLAYRFASNQRAIRHVKNLLQAHLLEVRLFQDQLGVVWRAYGKLLRATLAYLGWSVVPLVVVALPVTLLIAQLDLRFGARPLQPGESAILVVHVEDPVAVDRVALDFPEGLVATAPLLRIPPERRVVARFESRVAGRLEIAVRAGDEQAGKEVVTGGGLQRVSAARLRGGWFERLLEPGEEALPRAGAISSITLQYPERRTGIGGWEVNWLVLYFLLTLVAGFALKPIVGAEF